MIYTDIDTIIPRVGTIVMINVGLAQPRPNNKIHLIFDFKREGAIAPVAPLPTPLLKSACMLHAHRVCILYKSLVIYLFLSIP